jgi:copper chaperone CopZ
MAKIIKVKIKIGGIHCTSCSILIDGDLEGLKGVVSAKTNYARGECEIEFDEQAVTLDKILATIKALGYKTYI